MNIELPFGKYIVAVSGGVDSVVLLDLLRKKPGLELIVAHFNHGIRVDSAKDEILVASLAGRYKLKYEQGRGMLGEGASEATARVARYDFLHQVRQANNSDYIITAHHQDDLIETVALNMLRGTGYRGLTAIFNNPKVKRPLLNTPKTEIIRYAMSNKLRWSEDSTNKQDTYLRNYLRNQILPRLSDKQRRELLKNIEKVAKTNNELNTIIATLSHNVISGDLIDRHKFIMLPPEIANELVVYWLRQQKLAYDKKLIKRLSLSIKTAKAGTSVVVSDQVSLEFDSNTALFTTSVRST
ncbi:tRNA lysidine(34) synthetase TilS [Candidatus Saccharibacteria bacterium CG10_big_fil_rev_8_21_14_0_10_47_8]|nr:MAG: tRNA lysidine(34) synthetase TilS [Candidatus Saccharibacteria bacterium CG10_big_fil_rev_8_21_14_0_10_47_8]